jgi:hypothetical protein
MQTLPDADHLGTRAVTTVNCAELQILGELPSQTFTQSRFWRYQLAAAADALAADTRTIGAPIPRCTGEEMILHLVLRRAAAAAGCPPGQVFDWPNDASHAEGWGDLFEDLFQDHDVLMLYDAPQYGMTHLGGVNMQPNQWFSEFSLPYPVPARNQ